MPETLMKTICNHCKQEFSEDELTEFPIPDGEIFTTTKYIGQSGFVYRL